MPAPEMTRVVQMEPAPTPTLTASAPASISASVPSAVTTLPAMTGRSGQAVLMRWMARITPAECPCAVSIATTSTPSATSSCDALFADRRPRRPLRRPAGVRARPWRRWEIARFLDILDGDQAFQMPGLIHQGQLFDAILLQQALGLFQGDAHRRRHQRLRGS